MRELSRWVMRYVFLANQRFTCQCFNLKATPNCDSMSVLFFVAGIERFFDGNSKICVLHRKKFPYDCALRRFCSMRKALSVFDIEKAFDLNIKIGPPHRKYRKYCQRLTFPASSRSAGPSGAHLTTVPGFSPLSPLPGFPLPP